VAGQRIDRRRAAASARIASAYSMTRIDLSSRSSCVAGSGGTGGWSIIAVASRGMLNLPASPWEFRGRCRREQCRIAPVARVYARRVRLVTALLHRPPAGITWCCEAPPLRIPATLVRWTCNREARPARAGRTRARSSLDTTPGARRAEHRSPMCSPVSKRWIHDQAAASRPHPPGVAGRLQYARGYVGAAGDPGSIAERELVAERCGQPVGQRDGLPVGVAILTSASAAPRAPRRPHHPGAGLAEMSGAC
jgi:hypothetical protein